MGCASRYVNPYTFVNGTSNNTHVCFTFAKLPCETSPKCSFIQQSLRKLVIATRQSPECGAKNLTKGPSQSLAPFASTITSPSGFDVNGLHTVYFHHVFNGTATALDIKKVGTFVRDGDVDLHGYRVCIIGAKWRTCLLYPSQKLRVSTIDVTDRTCDQPTFVKV